MHPVYKNLKTCSHPLFIKNQTAERMLPAINFEHGLHYHFKVRFHCPCLSGSLVLRRSLNTTCKGNIIKHVVGKLKLLAIATTETLPAWLDLFTFQIEAGRCLSVSFHELLDTTDGISESTLNNSLTFWPQTQRLVQSWQYQTGTQNQWPILLGKIKSRTLRRQIIAPMRLGGRESTGSLGPSRDQQRSWHKQIQSLQYQWLGYPNTHSCHQHNFLPFRSSPKPSP